MDLPGFVINRSIAHDIMHGEIIGELYHHFDGEVEGIADTIRTFWADVSSKADEFFAVNGFERISSFSTAGQFKSSLRAHSRYLVMVSVGLMLSEMIKGRPEFPAGCPMFKRLKLLTRHIKFVLRLMERKISSRSQADFKRTAYKLRLDGISFPTSRTHSNSHMATHWGTHHIQSIRLLTEFLDLNVKLFGSCRVFHVFGYESMLQEHRTYILGHRSSKNDSYSMLKNFLCSRLSSF